MENTNGAILGFTGLYDLSPEESKVQGSDVCQMSSLGVVEIIEEVEAGIAQAENRIMRGRKGLLVQVDL